MTRSLDGGKIHELFSKLHVWKRHGYRAPNKPLLVLWSIGRCLDGQSRLAPFQLVEEEVGELIREFGHPRVQIHADYPFWRLRNDGVWEVAGANTVRTTSSSDAYKQDLYSSGVSGGFSEDIYSALQSDRSLAIEIAYSLARAHFPFTRQEEVLEAAGIRFQPAQMPKANQNRRDSGFRRVVLGAYDYRCALCGFGVHLSHNVTRSQAPVALDAAHIKWHQAGGPAKVQNGLALCVLHHRLFDSGAFTFSNSLTVVVAESAHGTGSKEWLWRFSGQPLPGVLKAKSRPDRAFLAWHLRNVFRGTALP